MLVPNSMKDNAIRWSLCRRIDVKCNQILYRLEIWANIILPTLYIVSTVDKHSTHICFKTRQTQASYWSIYLFELKLQDETLENMKNCLYKTMCLTVDTINFTLKTSRFHCSDLMPRNQTFKY
jgi:hypothetical protein